MQALGLLIEGLTPTVDWDGGDAPVLYIEGDVDSLAGATNVADLTALTGLVLRPWIPVREDAFGGFNWGATPRDPFGKPAPVTVEITDKDDVLGPLWSEDIGEGNTLFYRLQDTRVTRAQTIFRVSGVGILAAPAVDKYLWLRGEAVFVINVTAIADGVWDVEVDRAQCGSRALPHQIHPRAYPGSGLDQALYFSTRPDFDHQYFPCRLYVFDVTGSTITTARIKSFGYLAARPRPNGTGWKLTVMPDEQRLLDHQHGGKTEVALSRCVRVTEAYHGYGAGTNTTPAQGEILLPNGKHPRHAVIWMTRLEAESVFEESLHKLEDNYLDLDTFPTRMQPGITGTIPFQWALQLDVGGWSGLMAITGILGYYPSNEEPLVQVTLSLLDAWEGSLGDAPIAAINSADFTDDRLPGLNPGWTNRINDKVRPDEDPPKATLWLVSNGVTQAEAFLYLYLSGNGDGTNDATYDKLPCNFGFDGDPNRLNVGSTPANPIAVDQGTSLLLELNALLPDKLEYQISAGDVWGPWLVNESLRSMCLWVPEPSTGKVGWRQMDRPGPSSPTVINPVRSAKYKVEPGARLPAVESIRFEVGYKGKARTWQDFRILQLAEADSYRDNKKLPSEITIRHWKRGQFFGANLTTGPVPRISNFYFRQLRAAPSVFKVPVSVLRGPVKVGDFISWTDETIQTAAGRGVSDLICQVIAQDTNNQGGEQWLLVLPWALSIQRTATGKIAPALRIIHSEIVSATVFDVWCYSVGDTTVNLSTAYNGLYPAIVAASGRLRVVSPSRHNPLLAGERSGWLEASCTLTSVSSEGGVHRLRLSFNSNWTRSSTIDIRRDLLVHDQAYLVLSDRRPSGSNVEGAEIVPPAAQRKGAVGNVIDVATIAPPAPQQPYDGYYYLFS